MSDKKGQPFVVFVDRGRLEFYGDFAQNVVSLDLAESITKDLEVFDRKQLDATLGGFIKQAKILPSEIIFVLSDNILFQKDFSGGEAGNTQNFYENVPFETLLTKTYKTTTGIRAVAANSKLIQAILGSFEQRGFDPKAVIPAFVLGEHAPKGNLDPEKGNFILGAGDFVEKNTMLTVKQKAENSSNNQNTSFFLQKERILLMTVVVLVLIIVLLVVLLLRR